MTIAKYESYESYSCILTLYITIRHPNIKANITAMYSEV